MKKSLLQKLLALPLEEKIINTGAVIAFVGLLSPWISGKWLGGEEKLHTGFGFYTSFLGISIFILIFIIFVITFLPLTSNKELVQSENKQTIRFYCSALSVVIMLCSITVLMKVTWDFHGLEVRYGVYTTLIGTLVCFLYSSVLYFEERRKILQNFFHQEHETQHRKNDLTDEVETVVQTKSPPPPPPSPESHSMRH